MVYGSKRDFFSESAYAFVSFSNIPFISLSSKIWILETKICLEMKDVFKFESFRVEACRSKKATLGWIAQPW